MTTLKTRTLSAERLFPFAETRQHIIAQIDMKGNASCGIEMDRKAQKRKIQQKTSRCVRASIEPGERSHPLVVDRKNWLFSDTPEGAEASVIVYSLIETAKANGLNVEQYLLCNRGRMCV